MSRWWWDLLEETRGWIVALVIAFIVLGAVAACGADANPPEPQPEQPYTEVGRRAQLYDAISPEGVRCVVLIRGGVGVGLSCDWGER